MDGKSPVDFGELGRWWGTGPSSHSQTEIDIMGEQDKDSALFGECKWTTGENGKQLTAELLRKANLLPFAQNYTIIPLLFLKKEPKDDIGNAMFPEDIVKLMK